MSNIATTLERFLNTFVMKIIPIIILSILLLVKSGLSIAIQSPRPLPQIIEDSGIILICHLDNYVPNKAQDVTLTPSGIDATGQPFFSGPDVYIAMNSIKGPGTYSFSVLKVVKGAGGSAFSLDLPYILSSYFGGARPPIETNANFLLFLKKTKDGISLTDITVPLVPVSAGINLNDNPENINAEVVNDLLASSKSVTLRQADTYLLQPFVDPHIVIGVLPFLNDTNIFVKDNVLSCLAMNQQVSVIPIIVKLSHDPKLTGPSNAVNALQDYNVSQAVPYLNPILFDHDYYLRIKTISSLYKIADETSIPYLILSLRDPVPGGDVQAAAYVALRRLIPSLGAYVPVTSDYFTDNQDKLFKPLYAWWSDELLGKHLKPGEHPAIPSPLPDTPAQLYPLLFIPDVATRRAAAARLAQSGDADSIPYLILALQDPDTQQPDVNVSYVAYKALHRLIPSLGPAIGSDDYAADHAAATQPIYDWWRDELSGKHLSAQHP